MTLGCLMSSSVIGFFGGSSIKTSSPAPPQWPELMDFNNASSSTIPPRATFIILTPFLHLLRVVEFIRSRKEEEEEEE